MGRDPLSVQNPLKGAELKIERARRHLNELAAMGRELTRNRGLELAISSHAAVGKAQLLYLPDPMPLEFACVVGDAAHNIRSAFDFIAVALTIPPIGTREDAKDVYSPTGRNWQEFITARDGIAACPPRKGRKGKMEGAPRAALLLVENLEPYHGGKHSLRSLHDLDILDKHKLLVPAIARIHIHKLEMSFRGQRLTLNGADFQSGADGQNFVAAIDCPGITSSDELERDGEFRATFDIVFGKGQPFEGKLVVETLLELADLADGVVETCAAMYPNALRYVPGY